MKQGQKVKGTAKEKLGWVTGDRHAEAEGEAEQEAAERSGGPPDEKDVEKAEERVRRDHGDIR